MYSNYRMVTTILMGLMLLALSGCGQTGPLYLPASTTTPAHG